jgi:hypothetical protein
MRFFNQVHLDPINLVDMWLIFNIKVIDIDS